MKREKEYEIERTLVLSTLHISNNDINGLDFNAKNTTNVDKKHPCNIIVDRYDYGYIVLVDPELKPSDYTGYSSSFKRIMRLAKEQKCEYLKIDRDGTVYPHLNSFK